MDTLSPVLESLLDKANRALVECEHPVGRVVYVAGNTVAWDNCCGTSDEGGQLWVRVVSLLPMPQGNQPCDITDLQVRCAVGVVRCQHCLDEDNENYAPNVEEMLEDARAQGRDADTILRAIRTWLDEDFSAKKFVNQKSLKVEQGLPLGPEGCCGGWEWTLTFRLLMCGGC